MKPPASSSTQALHVLRGILRLARTPTLPKDLARKRKGPPPRLNSVQTFFLQQYREAKTVEADLAASAPPTDSDSSNSTSASAQERRRRHEEYLTLAANYHQLRRDIAERARLYELDTGAEVVLSPKEMSRRAAARAGLQLPKLDPELLSGNENGAAAGGAAGTALNGVHSATGEH